MFIFALTFQTFVNGSAYFGLGYSEISLADALLFLASMKVCELALKSNVKPIPGGFD